MQHVARRVAPRQLVQGRGVTERMRMCGVGDRLGLAVYRRARAWTGSSPVSKPQSQRGEVARAAVMQVRTGCNTCWLYREGQHA